MYPPVDNDGFIIPIESCFGKLSGRIFEIKTACKLNNFVSIISKAFVDKLIDEVRGRIFSFPPEIISISVTPLIKDLEKINETETLPPYQSDDFIIFHEEFDINIREEIKAYLSFLNEVNDDSLKRSLEKKRTRSELINLLAPKERDPMKEIIHFVHTDT